MNPRAVYAWQYNGVAPFMEIVKWCEDNFGINPFTHKHETIYFANRNDYAYFILRWGA
jgi:hypothetical protein